MACAAAGLFAAFGPLQAMEKTEPLPFVEFDVGDEAFEALPGADGAIEALREMTSGRRIEMPPDIVPLEILELGDRQLLVLGRTTPLGHLSASIVSDDGRVRTLEIAIDQRLSFYLHAAFQSGGRLFALVYDVTANLPSGRRVDRVASEALDLYEMKIADGKLSFLDVARGIPLGGIDVAARILPFSGGALACTQAGCVKLSAVGRPAIGPILTPPDGHPHRQLVEAASDGARAYAIYQGEYDDRFSPPPAENSPGFSICEISEKPSCNFLPTEEIPYGLSVVAGAPRYETVRTRGDLARLIEHDLRRMPHHGIAAFAENNLEGRLAWSAVYYLNGVLELAEQSWRETFGGSADLLRRKARDRALAETLAIARLGRTAYPWYFAKRYSLQREPIASLVHLGRFAALFARAERLGGQREVHEALLEVSAELTAPTRVIEEFRTPPLSPHPQLGVRRFAPFWADGSSAPWNYMSAWIEGGASGGGFARNKRVLRFAEACARSFQEIEKLDLSPKQWNYSAGSILEGWSPESGVSANTPEWRGDKTQTTTAHISYRSMDAMALAALRRAGSDAVPAERLAYLARLVEEGLLYPFVARGLEAAGQPVNIPPHIARLYARSALPWQIQNQATALERLARRLPP
jgi:hypothetical protein